MTPTLTPAIIFALLKTFAIPTIDAHEENRNERLQTIAAAVFASAERATCKGQFATPTCKPIAGDDFEVAAEVAGKANFETHLRSNVHADQCKPWECDPVRLRTRDHVIIYHRARSPWQLQRPKTWSNERWESIRGDSLEATTNAAWEATKLLQGYRGMCGGTTEGAFAGYASGSRKCKHKDAARRAHLAERYRAMLVAIAAKGEQP